MEYFLSSVMSFFLVITRDYVVFPFIIFGIIFLDRKIFLRAAVLILFGMILNIYLKSLFHIPLKPHLGTHTWSFPSGHTQFTATFYGYLAYSYRENWVKVLSLIAVVGVGCALVYFNYHNWMDVFAAIAVAAVLVVLFDKISKMDLFKNRLYLLSALLLGLSCVLLPYCSRKGASVPLIVGSHIGLTLGLFIENICSLKGMNKIWELCLLVGGGVFLYVLIPLLPLASTVASYVLYGSVVCWAVCGPRLMNKTS